MPRHFLALKRGIKPLFSKQDPLVTVVTAKFDSGCGTFSQNPHTVQSEHTIDT